MPYIYIIRTRASVNINEPVYKIGKTNDFNKRLLGYDKGSESILVLYVNDCDSFERILLELFNLHFIKRTDYGNEYFEGNLSKMINIIIDKFNELNMCYSHKDNEIEGQKQIEPCMNNNQELLIKKRNLLQKIFNKVNEKNINKFANDFIQVTSNLHNQECRNMICNLQNSISNYNVNIINSKRNLNICVYKKFGDYLQNNSNILFEITYNHLYSNTIEVKNFYNLFNKII